MSNGIPLNQITTVSMASSPFVCARCYDRFTHEKNLRRHFKIKHASGQNDNTSLETTDPVESNLPELEDTSDSLRSSTRIVSSSWEDSFRTIVPAVTYELVTDNAGELAMPETHPRSRSAEIAMQKVLRRNSAPLGGEPRQNDSSQENAEQDKRSPQDQSDDFWEKLELESIVTEQDDTSQYSPNPATYHEGEADAPDYVPTEDFVTMLSRDIESASE